MNIIIVMSGRMIDINASKRLKDVLFTNDEGRNSMVISTETNFFKLLITRPYILLIGQETHRT